MRTQYDRRSRGVCVEQKSQKNQYILSIETNGLAGGVRGTFPFMVKVSNVLPVPVFQAAAESAKRLRQYAEQSIERSKRVAAEIESYPMLLKKLFRSDENELSDGDIVDNAMTFIIAGSDTTANTMTYLIWAVCKRVQVRDELGGELRSLHADFSVQDLRGLPLLNNVIKKLCDYIALHRPPCSVSCQQRAWSSLVIHCQEARLCPHRPILCVAMRKSL